MTETKKDFSDKALLKFLDYASEKGLMNQATAQSRKTASQKIFNMLEPEEKSDLRKINYEDVFARYETKHAHDMGPESFVTYKSRGKKALEDFLVWVENPSGFRPKKISRLSPRKQKENTQKPNEGKSIEKDNYLDEPNQPNTNKPAQQLQVVIRGDVVIKVLNLPYDLKKAEADRINKIIQAHILEDQ